MWVRVHVSFGASHQRDTACVQTVLSCRFAKVSRELCLGWWGRVKGRKVWFQFCRLKFIGVNCVHRGWCVTVCTLGLCHF